MLKTQFDHDYFLKNQIFENQLFFTLYPSSLRPQLQRTRDFNGTALILSRTKLHFSLLRTEYQRFRAHDIRLFRGNFRNGETHERKRCQSLVPSGAFNLLLPMPASASSVEKNSGTFKVRSTSDRVGLHNMHVSRVRDVIRR